MRLKSLKYLKVSVLILLGQVLFAQNSAKVEGFLAILQRDVSDSLYIKLNIDIADEFIFNNPDTAAYFTKKALQRAEESKNMLMLAKAENYLGIIEYTKGHLLTSLEHYQRSQSIYKSINDRSGAVKAINNMANVFTTLGEHEKAIKMYEEAFTTNVELNLIDEAASNIFNIAGGYLSMKKFDRVRESLAQLRNFNRISKTSIDPCHIEAELFIQENKLDSALICLNKSYDISLREGDEVFVASILISRAQVYFKLDNLFKCQSDLDEAEKIILKNDYNDLLLSLYQAKADMFAEKNNFSEAYKFAKKYEVLKDSLDSINNFNRISELNAKYESEKREAEIAKQAQVIQQKNGLFRISIIIGIALISIMVVLIYNFFRKKKMNLLLKEQNNEIKRQRHKVISSINYARRIQNSILPLKENLKEFLPDSFVFFQPKDIVSGDFYWYRWIDDRLYIAAIDCTGHGVPGAFMSLIANSKLNKTINELKLREPHDILFALHHEIMHILNQERDPQNAQDGLDISLCVIDKQKKLIRFAGANLGIYIAHDQELIEMKPQPFSLGGIVYEKIMHARTNPFQTQEYSYQTGDKLFMYSDGFFDQLGGSEGKKFNKARFKQMLHQLVKKESVGVSGVEVCTDRLNDWKSGMPQTDDILIIGATL